MLSQMKTDYNSPTIQPNTTNSNIGLTIVILLGGFIARLWAASRGHNFDFESWLIAADISSHGGNIYAETSRYIYGPVWFLLLGMLWPIARLFSDSALAFHYVLAAGPYQVGAGERLALSGDAALLLPDNRFSLSTLRVEP